MRNQEIIKTLNKCINHCTYCADACLDEFDVKMMVPCIRLDRACAEVCSALKRILLTAYTDFEGLVAYCIRICEACAEECGKHDLNHCQDCDKACRECAEACKQLLNG